MKRQKRETGDERREKRKLESEYMKLMIKPLNDR